jgi:putative ABC transport system permease protein
MLIGVVAVVALSGLMTGVERYIEDQFSTALGGRVFHVSRYGGFSDLEDWLVSRSWPPIDPDQAEKLARSMTTAEAVSWRSSTTADATLLERTAQDIRFLGLTPSDRIVSGTRMEAGRFYTESENRSAARVCVLGMEVARALGTPDALVGRRVTIDGRRFRVIGVAAATGRMFGMELDDFVSVPFGTFRVLYPRIAAAVAVSILPREGVGTRQCMEEARAVLRRIRKLPMGDPDNFNMTSQETLLRSIEDITTTASAVTIGVAAIALLVGGIGIMNIMLVSVTERTREIGTRMAVGAHRGQIITQFLSEAVGVSLLGGIAGLVLGSALVAVSGKLTPLPTGITLWSVVLGLGFSAGAGALFGIYPAWRAARLDPVEALRYE